jgi:zinc transport system ATP-binding protein
MPILRVEHLNVTIDGLRILRDVNMTVDEGEVVAIIGPNGSGKTVLFKALLGLVPYDGTVAWKESIRIGYVPQRFAIDRAIPVLVRELLDLEAVLRDASYQQFRDAIRTVGINDVMDRRVSELSGGQLQRVLIARSLIAHPDVFMLDEPTAGIDVAGEKTVYELIHTLATSRRLSMLIISHDLHVVPQFSNRIVCLNQTVVCDGTPRDVLSSHRLGELYHNHHDRGDAA